MSNFQDRATLEQVVATGTSTEGRALGEDEIGAARQLLEHPRFDRMSIDDRRAFYQSRLAYHPVGQAKPGDPVMIVGWLLVGLGVLTSIASFFMDTAIATTADGSSLGDIYVPGSTTVKAINIGLLQNQLMVFQAGLALAIAGVVLLAAVVTRKAIVTAVANR